MNHTFDWQKEEHGYKSSFLGWLVPHLIAPLGNETFEKISDSSDRFTKVEIGITINGEPVDAKGFLDNLENVIMGQARSEAKEMLTELKHLDGLQSEVDKLQNIVSQKVNQIADAAGIELGSWD